MNLLYDKTYLKNFIKITQNNTKLKNKIVKKINLFIEYRTHPSLRLHKINTSKGEIWSISVDMNYRILIKYINQDIILLDIGTHEDIY